jgi:hypothetical protein
MRELVSGPALFRTASFADEIEIYPMRYELLEGGGEPAAPETLAGIRGLTEVDRLNVCDSREETAHDYSFVSSAGAAPLWGTARIDTYPESKVPLADGGRAILGRESFRIAARPGRELLMVLRTAPAIDANLLQTSGPRRVGLEFPDAAFTVSVDGRAMGRANVRTRPGWNEVVIRITGNLVRQERPRLELAGRYASFQYWFFQ